ncbi:17302_t:CDS:2 [Acaulospora morrowiae]|uniref:17302_t:CDS:1 n=1 Tax=Acaulospora morrowiae TaxID=94023 RepID=A0A9N9CKW6_9GLOM|nr:17302_t:CDS:2 [Acaulospora morrowiae]
MKTVDDGPKATKTTLEFDDLVRLNVSYVAVFHPKVSDPLNKGKPPKEIRKGKGDEGQNVD